MNFSELNRISSGFTQSRILQVGVKLGVFDLIENGGSSSSEVARALGANHRSVELFLNALVAMKVLFKVEGRFHNTETSLTYLVKSSPKYFGSMIMFEEGLWNLWANLEDSVLTGNPAKSPDMFQTKPEETEKFITAMHSLVMARGDAEILSDILDLKWAKKMIDIGAGPGTYLIHFLERYPHLEVTIFDLPGTLKITKRFLEKEGVTGKIQILEGDYNMDELPTDFDIAFLSNIIHSEDENTNKKLMKKVFAALNERGEVIVKDHILDDSLTNPSVGAIFSIQMLLATKGRDYSFTEVKAWLEEAGFKRVKSNGLPPPLPLPWSPVGKSKRGVLCEQLRIQIQ